jgi:hypothetical protein
MLDSSLISYHPPLPLLGGLICGDVFLMGMGVNLRQMVSEAVYTEFVNGDRVVLILQSNKYYDKKLKGKKYLWLQNEEFPEKPDVRFLIESVEAGHGGVFEDIYGQRITGPHLRVALRKREKTG